MFTAFDNLKERVQNAQQGLSDGWKNIADKAKKEVKIVNKFARKALQTEDGGKLRDGYVVTVNLNAGYDVFKGFQDSWIQLHKESVTNVKKAEQVDRLLNDFTKEWQKYESYLEELQGNLIVLPEVIAKVEIIQKRIDAIGSQTKKIEDLILEYEDACERYELEKCKVDMRVKLSHLVESKHAEYTLKKSAVSGENEECSDQVSVIKELSMKKIAAFPPLTEVSQAAEKQKAYEDAFLDQMNQYIQYGEIEKPIAGSLNTQASSVEEIQIDESDLSTLREFLGPEEINSVIQAQASQAKMKSEKESPSEDTPTPETADSVDVKSTLLAISQSGDSTENENVNREVEDTDESTVASDGGTAQTTECDIVSVQDESNETLSTPEGEAPTKLAEHSTEGSDDDNEFFDAASDHSD